MEQVPMGQVPMGLPLPDQLPSQQQQPQLMEQLGGDNGKKNSFKDRVLTGIGHNLVGKVLKASKSKRAEEAKDQLKDIVYNIDESGRDRRKTDKPGIVQNIIANEDKKSDMPDQKPAADLDPIAAQPATAAVAQPAAPTAAASAAPSATTTATAAAAPAAAATPASLRMTAEDHRYSHLTSPSAEVKATAINSSVPSDSVAAPESESKSKKESESDVIKFLQYFGVNTDNDTNTVYFENLKAFETSLIQYKEDILKKSLLYKIHDIYQGNGILSSFNIWAKMYIFERRSGVKSKTKQTMKNFSELLGMYIYILIKLLIVMWILYILFKSKKPNNFLNITFKIFIVYYIIFTFIGKKRLLLQLKNAFFRGI